MAYSPYYIRQYEPESGFENYYESFLLPEKAFPILENAYCWRGRVKRRLGFKLLGRLRRFVSAVAQPNTGGVPGYAVPDVLSSFRTPAPPIVAETYAQIQIGTFVVTVDRGNPNETVYSDNPVNPGVLTLVSGPYTISAGTIDYNTGALSMTFTVVPVPGTKVDINAFYYPMLPCMGIETYEQPAINAERTIAFDQKYAYEYNIGTTQFQELTGSLGTTWQGPDYKLFWSTNYYNNANGNLFWTTNNNDGLDPIRYYDSVGWTTFNPLVNAAADRLQQCLCILPFKDRLIAFNTWEGANLAGAVNYRNRVRWSQNGSPLMVTGLEWLDDTPGYGGYLDAPTQQAIVSVEYLKDVILVKFERSSYKLVYTGNEALPFVFQKINTELGIESTFSLVPFDETVLGIGNYGITADDTTSVQRIDVQIPDQVFQIANSLTTNAVKRPCGIRDYINELVYWTFPDNNLQTTGSPKFNNKVLVYNYRNKSYATFTDSFTCYGLYQHPTSITTSSIPLAPETLAGNQQGFIELLNKEIANDFSLAITAITPGTPVTITCPNHNFSANADYWVIIDNIRGAGPNNPESINFSTSGLTFKVKLPAVNPNDNFTLQVWNGTAFVDYTLGAGGTYFSGGEVFVVTNFNITTKVFAPYYEGGKQARFGYMDLLLDKTGGGKIAANVFINENPTSVSDPTVVSNIGLLGNSTISTAADNASFPGQANQAKIWHRFFSGDFAQNFQIQLKMNNDQMSSYAISANDFVMHAMTLYISEGARMTQ